MTTQTLPRVHQSTGALFLDQCHRSADREAFRAPAPDGGWRSLTWADTAKQARELAAGLLALGIQPEQRIGIAATTRIEWVLADLAVALTGAATTTVYPTTNAEDVAYIVSDCGAVIVFAEDATQLEKLRADDGFVGEVQHVVLFDGDSDDEKILTLDRLADLGRYHLSEHSSAVDEALAAVTPENLATIIYTSGTTGRPKGVELTHGNWLYIGSVVAAEKVIRRDHVQFLWLPLSHVFGKLLLAAQYDIGFVTTIDGRIDRIVDNVGLTRPSFMAAAPRIFEKIYSRAVSTVEAEGGLKARIFARAFEVGIDAVRRKAAGKPVPLWQQAELVLADRLVFGKIRDRLGGNLEYLASGSAALPPQIAEWFAAAGLPILEGYGLSEVTGAATVNRPGSVKIGTVGQPFPGTEVRIADDGEILLRGPGIMRGYHNLPDKTAEVLDADGWFATGDIGEVDADNFVKITDRKKDLVKTSGGKYIAPTVIESAVKAACPIVSSAIVIADGRNFASVLLTLDPDAAAGVTDVNGTIEAAIRGVNARLNKWETVKQFRILPRELTVESGELTPSLKVKRPVVVKNYAHLIDDIYSGKRA